jgi:hypothetical protein
MRLVRPLLLAVLKEPSCASFVLLLLALFGHLQTCFNTIIKVRPFFFTSFLSTNFLKEFYGEKNYDA